MELSLQFIGCPNSSHFLVSFGLIIFLRRIQEYFQNFDGKTLGNNSDARIWLGGFHKDGSLCELCLSF